VAVLARGNCTLTLEQSEISGNVALQVQGNATVSLLNCRVEGSSVAVEVSGNGTVRASGSVFRGRLAQAGNGSFEDGGGNSWQR